MKNELLVNPLNRAGQARYPIAICQIRVVIVVVKVVMLIVLSVRTEEHRWATIQPTDGLLQLQLQLELRVALILTPSTTLT